MHFSAPAHPLIHGFLLRREEFQGMERLIVETREQGEKLLATLAQLNEIEPTGKQYRLISTLTDIVEVMYDDTLVGIFPVETLDWKIDEGDMFLYCLFLEKGQKQSEEKLISWLSEHGYTARKSDEIGTYFRAGDTISIPLKKGMLRVSFFGSTIEDLFLQDEAVTSVRIYSLNPSLPREQIS